MTEDHPLYSMVKSELHQLKERLLASVYVLYRNGRIVYVGQSYRTYARIYTHLSSGLQFDSWRMAQIEDTPLRLVVERMLIQLLNPDGNFDAAVRAAIHTYRINSDMEGTEDGQSVSSGAEEKARCICAHPCGEFPHLCWCCKRQLGPTT